MNIVLLPYQYSVIRQVTFGYCINLLTSYSFEPLGTIFYFFFANSLIEAGASFVDDTTCRYRMERSVQI